MSVAFDLVRLLIFLAINWNFFQIVTEKGRGPCQACSKFSNAHLNSAVPYPKVLFFIVIFTKYMS